MLKKAKKDVDMRCEMELYMLIYVDDHVFFHQKLIKFEFDSYKKYFFINYVYN